MRVTFLRNIHEKKVYPFVISSIFVFFLIMSPISTCKSSNPAFIQSYWATDDYATANKQYWNDANKIPIETQQGMTGQLLVKNTYDYLYIGIELDTELTSTTSSASSSLVLLNIDSNNDKKWADDCKGIYVSADEVTFDAHYNFGQTTYSSDSGSRAFIGASIVDGGTSFIIFEIALTSSNVLENLQIPQVDGATVGISFDIINPSGLNDTMAGQLYPNFANATSYSTVVLADPSQIAAPEFGTQTSSSSSSSSSETLSPEEKERLDDQYGAANAPGFTTFIIIPAMGILVIMHYRRKRRENV